MKHHYQLLRNFVSGHIYDSGPVDVTSDFGLRFALHPAFVKMPGPSRLVSWIAKCVASGFDALYLTRFESLAAEHWQALYSSVVSIYFDHLEFLFLGYDSMILIHANSHFL